MPGCPANFQNRKIFNCYRLWWFGGLLAVRYNRYPHGPRVMDESKSEVTVLLRAWSAGDRTVEDRLFALVLPDLRKIARHLMSRERQNHSLEATALLNEAYLRLLGARDRDWEDRRHFFALAARAMRRLLIDHARARKRGHVISIDGFEDLLRGREEQLELAVSINGLLDEMERDHPDWCSIVELKFFAGFTDEDTANALGLSLRSMQRHFADARRWLYERLESARGV